MIFPEKRYASSDQVQGQAFRDHALIWRPPRQGARGARCGMGNVRLTVRVDFGANRALGPGKIRLLEAIGKTGSIARAGRALGMSYRRAWLLVDDMNRSFRSPVVAT